jgi:hypothetical protein
VRATRAIIASNVFFIRRLESEVNVEHVVESLHIEILGVEPVVTVLADAADKSRLLITAGLHPAVVEDIA